jgi:hypothetical protein
LFSLGAEKLGFGLANFRFARVCVQSELVLQRLLGAGPAYAGADTRASPSASRMKPACPAPGEQISVSFSTVDLGAYIDRTAKRNP